jgi:uncharacterized protein YjbI with pentapeptide repeats
MNPEVIAAIIAAAVSVLTLIGTLAAQYFGRRATSRDTQEALEVQGKQLDRTLAEQRTRTLNERFATAAEQLGSDKPAVRLAGVYAMAGLADDWEENRQTCVDVLCAYLRMPYEPCPGQDAPEVRRLAFQASREVRHTVIRVITAHLQDDAAVSWQGLTLDFWGVVFDGGDFNGARFADGTVSFYGAKFSAGTVYFNDTNFSGGTVRFGETHFDGGTISFNHARFSGSTITFSEAQFSGGLVTFGDARFSGGTITFSETQFSGGTVSFNRAHFSGSTINFGGTELDGARFSGGDVTFYYARFSADTVTFVGAEFSGGAVDFSSVNDWSFPPRFSSIGTSAPLGVSFPELG